MKQNPSEVMQKMYSADGYDFTKHQLGENEERKEEVAKEDSKPKYSKNDFFDSITNSTLEVRP